MGEALHAVRYTPLPLVPIRDECKVEDGRHHLTKTRLYRSLNAANLLPFSTGPPPHQSRAFPQVQNFFGRNLLDYFELSIQLKPEHVRNAHEVIR